MMDEDMDMYESLRCTETLKDLLNNTSDLNRKLIARLKWEARIKGESTDETI